MVWLVFASSRLSWVAPVAGYSLNAFTAHRCLDPAMRRSGFGPPEDPALPIRSEARP